MLALRADLLDFTATPAWGGSAMDGVRLRPDHWLLVGDDGRIVGAQREDPGPDWERHDHRGRLLMPGFIDTHVHCPQIEVMASYGTGLLDWQAAVDAAHHVSLGSDVGGGTSLCMLRTLADACKVQALQGTRLPVWVALHAATLGAATGLGLEGEMGHLGEGALADVVVWDWAVGAVAKHRDAAARGALPGLPEQPLHARVYAWMMLGDERNVAATYVAGEQRFARAPVS